NEVVACTPTVFAQLVRNLVTNAVKFQSRQRRLKLNFRSASRANEVELVIEDNGVGMTDKDLAHAFEPYDRGADHLEVPGHGLGLAIVQRTMEALGCSCGLARSPGGGTTVTL